MTFTHPITKRSLKRTCLDIKENMMKTIIAIFLIIIAIALPTITTVQAAAGDLDTTFDLDGIAVTDFGPNSAPTSIAIQADGKALVAGSSNLDFALVRYNTDGKLDQSFGVGGKVTTDFGGIGCLPGHCYSAGRSNRLSG